MRDALRAAGCVYAEEEADLLLEQAAGPEELRRLLARRVAGEPLEQVLGWAAFAGQRIRVRPGVFVPRVRSELLVRAALDGLAERAVVVDLGCGSGALGAAVAAAKPGVTLWAVDVDPTAVACARLNLPPARVRRGDLWAGLPDHLRGRIDVALVNAPYVPSAEIATLPGEAREHEHRVALDGGPDGLDVQRRVAAPAGRWLGPAGRLLVECGRHQAAATASLVAAAGLEPRVVVDHDLAATVVVGSARRRG